MRIDKDLVAASSTPLVLAILAEGENYGYAILKRVRELSAGELEWTDGMLYPLLHRLSRLGYVTTEWRTPDEGRRRRYYVITDDGRAALQRESDENADQKRQTNKRRPRCDEDGDSGLHTASLADGGPKRHLARKRRLRDRALPRRRSGGGHSGGPRRRAGCGAGPAGRLIEEVVAGRLAHVVAAAHGLARVLAFDGEGGLVAAPPDVSGPARLAGGASTIGGLLRVSTTRPVGTAWPSWATVIPPTDGGCRPAQRRVLPARAVRRPAHPGGPATAASGQERGTRSPRGSSVRSSSG